VWPLCGVGNTYQKESSKRKRSHACSLVSLKGLSTVVEAGVRVHETGLYNHFLSGMVGLELGCMSDLVELFYLNGESPIKRGNRRRENLMGTFFLILFGSFNLSKVF